MNNIHKIYYDKLLIDYLQNPINFHRNFTTAHSTSSTRINFYICARYQNIEGYGQCGLPPKKPGCYLSDINDCFQFMDVIAKKLELEKNHDVDSLDFLPSTISSYLQNLQNPFKNSIIKLLKLSNELLSIQHYRAPKTALQYALLDLLTRYQKTTITDILIPTPFQKHKTYSFYTISYDKKQQMLQNIKQHLKITKHIKIKWNNNIKQLIQLLIIIHQQLLGLKFIIDANCSWNIQDMEFFINNIKNINNYQVLIQKIVYIQQPFNFDIDNIEKWQTIKNNSPIKILADESFRNQADISKIKRVAHAVNIKLQKAGGPFAVLTAALNSKSQGLQIMFGTMCCTQLGCTQTFQFYPLAKYLDIDGALLIKIPKLYGGFVWGENGWVKPDQNGRFGMGVNAEEIFGKF